jgi:hypothetical protein
MTDPKVVTISNELLRRLRTISRGKDSTKWFSEPGYVGYGPDMGTNAKNGPAIFLNTPKWSDSKLSAGRHEATIEWTIQGIMDTSAEPESDIHKLAYDIIKVLGEADGDRLGGLIIDLDILTYTAATEYVEQAGRGELVLTATAKFQWTHSAP